MVISLLSNRAENSDEGFATVFKRSCLVFPKLLFLRTREAMSVPLVTALLLAFVASGHAAVVAGKILNHHDEKVLIVNSNFILDQDLLGLLYEISTLS